MYQRELGFDYLGRRIPFSIWLSDDSRVIDTVIFLGTVQIGKLPMWVAESSPPRTAVVQGAPHWHANEDGSDIPSYTLNFAKTAFDSLVTMATLETVNIIADSQAAPAVIQLFASDSYSSYMKQVVLLQPLGLNTSVFGGSDEQRMKILQERVTNNVYRQLPELVRDTRLRHNYRVMNKTVSFRDPRSRAQYSSGLSYDATPDLAALIGVNPNVVIVSGGADKIFIPTEIKDNLSQAGLHVDMVIVPGVPHSPLATRKGRVLLEKAFSLFK